MVVAATVTTTSSPVARYISSVAIAVTTASSVSLEQSTLLGKSPSRAGTAHHQPQATAWASIIQILPRSEFHRSTTHTALVRSGGVNWDEGRTYYGSSGSPLYDANHRIVGQLYGGSSFCTNDQDDVYGKLNVSWSGLDQYLDPANTGSSYLDTLNPYDGSGEGGVCCLSGSCYTVSEESCGNAGGTWQPGETCGTVNWFKPRPNWRLLCRNLMLGYH